MEECKLKKEQESQRAEERQNNHGRGRPFVNALATILTEIKQDEEDEE
jgi:hypothetical protein